MDSEPMELETLFEDTRDSTAMEIDEVVISAGSGEVERSRDIDRPSQMAAAPIDIDSKSVASYLNSFFLLDGCCSAVTPTLLKFLQDNTEHLEQQWILFDTNTMRVDMQIYTTPFVFVRSSSLYPFCHPFVMAINENDSLNDNTNQFNLLDGLKIMTNLDRVPDTCQQYQPTFLVSEDLMAVECVLKAFQISNDFSPFTGWTIHKFARLGLIRDQKVDVKFNTDTVRVFIGSEHVSFHISPCSDMKLQFKHSVTISIGYDNLTLYQKHATIGTKNEILKAIKNKGADQKQMSEDDNDCPICLNVALDPHVCKGCKKCQFCRICVERWMRATGDRKACPLCRHKWTEIGIDVLPKNSHDVDHSQFMQFYAINFLQ